MDLLIIEQSRVTRMVIREELGNEFNVKEAPKGEEALEILSQDSIELILLANTLKEESSYDLCEKIRQHSDFGDLPIFLMGTSDEKEYYQQGFEAGASAFLEKPFEKQELTRLLMHLSSRSEHSRGKSILVVDDSKSVRVVLRKALRDVGFEVIEAPNGKKGIKKLQSNPIDLISTDLEMPKMDGLEFVQEVRESPELPSPPILMLTSREEPEVQNQATEAGVDTFLNKPFQSDQYLKEIATLLNRELDSSTRLIFGADDSSLARTQLEKTLDREGFESRIFETGVEMLDAIKLADNENDQRIPDVILSDLLMPGLDGIQILETLRSMDPPRGEIPALIISSYEKPEAIVKALNAGANDFIAKPYVQNDVIERIKIHL